MPDSKWWRNHDCCYALRNSGTRTATYNASVRVSHQQNITRCLSLLCCTVPAFLRLWCFAVEVLTCQEKICRFFYIVDLEIPSSNLVASKVESQRRNPQTLEPNRNGQHDIVVHVSSERAPRVRNNYRQIGIGICNSST